MRKISAVIAVAAMLSGCAGSLAHIAMSPNAKQVNVGGETILVLAEAGIWSASFKDAMTSIKSGSPSSLLQRKAKLISAIETYSGCKVSDSTADPGMLSLHASVRCP